MAVGHSRDDLVLAGTNPLPGKLEWRLCEFLDQLAIGKELHLGQGTVRGIVGGRGSQVNGRR